MALDPTSQQRIAQRLQIRGVVQGVGFRPFVFRTAAQHGIAGWVLNDGAGVEVHAEAPAANLAAFVAELKSHPPAAASISNFVVEPAAALGFAEFQIVASRHAGMPSVRISPDLAICEQCTVELQDPSDRRFRYPYINCTNCGPRYSIIESLPYDRQRTTMRAWDLCRDCRREFEDPLDRRYHAQPVACAACGPGYVLASGETVIGDSETALRQASALLRDGRIVAIKGIGGYHLACDARSVEAVLALRERKYRKEKPFALLVRSLDEARALVELSAEHERLLADVARPIVLAPARRELPGVAPDNAALGIMLPYTPLHHLLFDFAAPSPLVLTSANRSNEPISYRDDDARERLHGIADAFLIGQRPIARRVDDSVVGVRAGQPFMIRRARGYAPGVVCRLPTTRPLLALGSDLKNTIALVVGGEVLVSQHIGDLGDAEIDRAFDETVRDLLAMYELDPSNVDVVHDLHPQFHSTRYAAAMPARRRIAVQHHHAHIASVLAEHELLDEPAVGVAFDGTGYCTDETIWGGEFFVGSVERGFARKAWLRPVRMPGGDAAARFPVQAAAGFLAELASLPDLHAPPFCFPRRFQDSLALVAKNVRCFVSTSIGRLFDAAAAVVGFVRPVTFEGQAAIWLEQRALPARNADGYPFAFDGQELDFRPLLVAMIEDRKHRRDVADISRAFQRGVARGLADAVTALCRQHRLDTVALSGGVFQNDLLLQDTRDALLASGLRLWTNQSVPPNDGGLSLGQAALAALSATPTVI